MAIFNEAFTDNLMVLNEKKTQEEYARRRFKEKNNFEPGKDDANIGTITDKASGKKYKVDMRKSKDIDLGNGKSKKRETFSDLDSEDSTIYLDKKFFHLKGSNKGERRDAVLQHEIGHQNLHNLNPKNNTVDSKNRTLDTYMSIHASKGSKYLTKDNIDRAQEYVDSSSASEYDVKKRKDGIEASKKYEKSNRKMPRFFEIEADRYAANHTSDNAVRKSLRNMRKEDKREAHNSGKRLTKSDNSESKDKYDIRSKALDDKDLKKSEIYK